MKEKYVTAFGEAHTIADWSRRTGINRDTISLRLKRGVSPEVALKTKGKMKRDNLKRYELNGRSQTLQQWANEIGTSYCAMYHRVCVRGMSLEDALKVKNQKDRRTEKYCVYSKSTEELLVFDANIPKISEILGLAPETVRSYIFRQGRPGESQKYLFVRSKEV